ncbi:MAG: peptide deformylase [Armatimonadetes bacterium]|nr:peptide deformylase [Armatimonadota bacterium]MDE2205529.1 peptide deformylase [Armatimonadota bacterium]
MPDTVPCTDPTLPPPELIPAWERHPEIVKIGDPVLLAKAAPVKRADASLSRLLAELRRLMVKADGVGLAAPQIGVSLRALVYDSGDGIRALVNPRIASYRGEQLEPMEGCLSIPGLRGTVKRAMEIRVKALDDHGRPITVRAEDFEARVIQHEMDHLDGILFIERAEPGTLVWLTGVGEDHEESPEE